MVSNAGVFSRDDGPVTTIDEAVFDRVLDVNLRGMFLCCKYAFPEIVRSGGGAAVLTSSTGATIGSPTTAYGTSKGGVLGLMRSLAMQYAAKGIRVNAILPGPIDTPLLKAAVPRAAPPTPAHAVCSAGWPTPPSPPRSSPSSPPMRPATSRAKASSSTAASTPPNSLLALFLRGLREGSPAALYWRGYWKEQAMPDIDVFEAIRTLRAVRQYRTDPVPEDALRAILEAGTRGPSAINRQPWKFIAVTGEAERRIVAEHYYRAGQENRGDASARRYSAGGSPKILGEAWEFATKGIHDVPAFIVVCLTERKALDSVLQGVQLMMLTARVFGLGTIFTTLHRRVEESLKRGLGIPDDVEVPCIIPVGYPVKPFGETRRLPVEAVAYRDRWERAYP